jgi:hypothetical protein
MLRIQAILGAPACSAVFPWRHQFAADFRIASRDEEFELSLSRRARTDRCSFRMPGLRLMHLNAVTCACLTRSFRRFNSFSWVNIEAELADKKSICS